MLNVGFVKKGSIQYFILLITNQLSNLVLLVPPPKLHLYLALLNADDLD